jgi:radical SAM superfamily enzyme YgiQ (UPF0313 family)
MKKQTILLYKPTRFSREVWLPALWCQSKSYYEKNGKNVAQWDWYPSYADMCTDDLDRVKGIISDASPTIFGISLYTWNVDVAFELAKWVKEQFPNCLVISGGPHQDFKYNQNWFREHPYIDCSVPGDSYGELVIAELLDNFGDTIDFNQISDIYYPMGKKRDIFRSKKTFSPHDKKNFDYDWCAYAHQVDDVEKFINYQQIWYPNSNLLANLETTKGCPYGCTYCDWGGGISTSVIKRQVSDVEQDIEYLMSLDLQYIYVGDANFGLFGDRDVEIANLFAKYKEKYDSETHLGFGGFAKTENRLKYIEQIFDIMFSNGLTDEHGLKVSLQTIYDDILKNIDRKNINLDAQLRVLTPFFEKYQMPMLTEIILGLPGMTLDKFYNEFDVFHEKKLNVMWYEWLLLPEAPAYDPEYRKKYSLVTTKKTRWFISEDRSEREIVIGSFSYTKVDYLEMMIAMSLYHALVRGNLFFHSLSNVLETTTIGNLIRQYLETFKRTTQWESLKAQWETICDDGDAPCEFMVGDCSVDSRYYFCGKSFLKDQSFISSMSELFSSFGCPSELIETDVGLMKFGSPTEFSRIRNEFIIYNNDDDRELLQYNNLFSKHITMFKNKCYNFINRLGLVNESN